MNPSTPDPKFSCPIRPFRGIRGVDAHGGGGYGAPRGQRSHYALDYIAEPGDEVVALFTGEIKRLSLSYKDAPGLGLVLIRSVDMGWYAEYQYVNLAGLVVGQPVKVSEPFTYASDIAAYYKVKYPARGPMTNHVHVALYRATDHAGIVFHPPIIKR